MQEKHEAQEQFRPVGAVAFFFAMIVFYALIWFSVYTLMLSWR